MTSPNFDPDPDVDVDLEPPAEPADNEYIEWVPSNAVEAELVSARSITRTEAKTGWGVSIPKDLEWTRIKQGKSRNRFLLPVSEISPDALKALETEPGFKRVTLND